MREVQRLGLISMPTCLVCCQANRLDFEPVIAKPTLASAIQIGNPVSLPSARAGLDLGAGAAGERGAARQRQREGRSHRAVSCPHTGVALACLEQLIVGGTIEPDDRVVIVSTAYGLRFTEFKTGCHEQRHFSDTSDHRADRGDLAWR